MPGHDDPTTHPPERRRRRAGGAIALLLTVGTLIAGCSSSEPAGPTPADAARTVVGGFGLESSELGCLEDAFAGEPEARRAMAIGGDASDEQQRRLQAVLEECITPLELATVLTRATAAAIPGTDETAQACLRSTIEGFDESTRRLFLLGFVLSGGGTATELGAELGTKTNELFARCGVSLPGSDAAADPTVTTLDPAGSAVSTG